MIFHLDSQRPKIAMIVYEAIKKLSRYIPQLPYLMFNIPVQVTAIPHYKGHTKFYSSLLSFHR